MKFIPLFLISFLTLSFQVHIRKTLPHPSSLDLPTTPKAQELRNHYGLSPFREIYGPNFTVSTASIMARNNDGTWTGLLNFNNDSIVSETCDIKRHSFYHICSIVTSCSICAAMDSCGWCQSTGECLPGNVDGCYCENACPPVGFFNTELKCEHIESSGTLSNIDPYATKLIDAEIVGPKINITTTLVHPEMENVFIREGEKVERRNITGYNAAENRLVSAEYNLAMPNINKIPMELLKIDKETRTYNASTGVEITQDGKVGLFGK